MRSLSAIGWILTDMREEAAMTSRYMLPEYRAAGFWSAAARHVDVEAVKTVLFGDSRLLPSPGVGCRHAGPGPEQASAIPRF